MSRRNGKDASAATPEPAIYHKTPVTPEEAFQAIGRLRKEARDEIDRLIRFLDETENHMEREPEDEDDDSELEEDDPGEDDGLKEPSLGSVTPASTDQTRWASGGRCDLEQDDGETGIADQDGLDEQVPCLIWGASGSRRHVRWPRVPRRRPKFVKFS
jgi:hypothetical protein